jgi:hypothetical protein
MCRAAGTAAASVAFGKLNMSNYDDATATTLQGNANMMVIPTNAPATVNINTTTANALSPTVQFSVSTATTQLTCLLSILEALT